MQDKEKDIFESSLANMLRDAEVKAPRSARKAVFARLVPAPSFNWAYASLAMAGAVAGVAVLFNFGGTRGLDQNPLQEAVAVVPHAISVPSSDSEISLDESLELLAMAEVPPRRISGNTIPQETHPNAEAMTTPAEILETTPQQTPVKVSKKEKDDQTARSIEYWTAEQKAEPVRKGSLSLTAKGNLGTQDSRFAPAGGSASFSSGYVPTGVREDTESTYGVPVSLGLGVRYNINDRWAVGTGLSWTMLSRSFEGKYKTSEGLISHYVHYIGVPVDVFYTLLNSSSTRFYVNGGLSAEKCISDSYFLRSESPSPIYSKQPSGFQFGLGAGFGVELKLSNHFGLYFNPSLRYYYGNNQPKSLRTDKPLMFNFEAGLKFNL